MKTISATLMVKVILTIDEGMNVTKFFEDSEIQLKSIDDRANVIDVSISNVFVTNSKI